MAKINDIVKEIHKNAVDKGWWESDRSPLEIHALVHSEISEATEEVRKDNPPLYYKKDNEVSFSYSRGKKPEGEAIELVDAVIRIMDYFGRKGWDLERMLHEKIDYNSTREHRHGGKKY